MAAFQTKFNDTQYFTNEKELNEWLAMEKYGNANDVKIHVNQPIRVLNKNGAAIYPEQWLWTVTVSGWYGKGQQEAYGYDDKTPTFTPKSNGPITTNGYGTAASGAHTHNISAGSIAYVDANGYVNWR